MSSLTSRVKVRVRVRVRVRVIIRVRARVTRGEKTRISQRSQSLACVQRCRGQLA